MNLKLNNFWKWLKHKIQDWFIKNIDEAPLPPEPSGPAWPQDPS